MRGCVEGKGLTIIQGVVENGCRRSTAEDAILSDPSTAALTLKRLNPETKDEADEIPFPSASLTDFKKKLGSGKIFLQPDN